MATILKRFRGVSEFWYFLIMASVSIICLGVIGLSMVGGMSPGLATLIVSTPVVLALAVIWSVYEVKRLNR